ncbi:MAG: M12 family metallo-peptidase, partial [Flavobacteriales bacterium]
MSAQLFEPSTSEVRAITVDDSRTVGISLDISVFEELRKSYPEEFILVLPDFNGGEVQLSLERFEPFPATVKVGIHSDRGYEELDYVPRIKTYKVRGGTGSFVLMTDYVLGTFQHNGMQIEVKPIDDKATDGEHLLFDVNNLIVGRDFDCAMEEVGTGDGHKARELEERSEKSLSGCAEIAVDIDSYTYSTFGNVPSATDWALALMTGVSQIYTQELGDLVFLQTTYVHIWQTADPMSNYTNQASEMLGVFRSTWLNDPILSGIQRDETHLLTKRGDTGTGGIAYLDVVCSTWAYGFSSALSGTSNYNISSWTWNLMVVSHELGHNLGSNHTQWCGWPGGPIDNCVSPEGGCSYEGGPVDEGTIMSYCHTNGSVPNVLNFHPTVQIYGLQSAINNNGSCFGGCEGYV